MFDDLIERKKGVFDLEVEEAIEDVARMDGICVFCPSSNPHLCFEDCTNYEQDDPERIQYPNVCKYFVGESDCTFHRV